MAEQWRYAVARAVRAWWQVWGIYSLLLAGTWVVFFSRQLFAGEVYFFDDLKSIFYPLEHEYARFQGLRQLPVWSPVFGFGQPLLAWGQLGFFTPINMLLRELQLHPVDVLQWSLMIYFALGLAGFCIFLHRRALPRGAAALGAIVFVFNGFNISHLQHSNFFTAVMVLPWLLLALEWWLARPTMKRATVVSAVAAVIAMSGHMQMVVYGLGAVALVGACLVRRVTWPLVRQAVVAVVLFGGLASLAILPLREFLPAIDRHAGLTQEQLYNFSYPPWHAITLIFPTYFGDRATYWGEKSLLELGAAVGILPLLLAGVGAASWRSFRRERLAGVTLVAVAIFLMLGKYTPWYRWVVEHGFFPPLTAPSRFLIFGVLGVAVLAAIGWHDLQTRKAGWWYRLLVAVGWLAAILLPFVMSGHVGAWRMVDSGELGLAAVGVVMFAALFGRQRTWVSGALIVVTAATLVYFGWQLNPVTPRAVALREPHFHTMLKNFASDHRYPARLYSETEIFQEAVDTPVPAIKRTDTLSSHFSVHQLIDTTAADFACVRVGLDTAGGSGELAVRVIDEATGHVVRRQEIALDKLSQTGEHTFCWEPITASAGKRWRMIFSRGQPGAGSVALRYTPQEGEGAFFIRVANPSAQELAASRKPFRLVYRPLYGQAVDVDRFLLGPHFNVTAAAGSARWFGSLSISGYHDFVRALFANDQATRDGDGVHILEKNRSLFDMASVTHAVQRVGPDTYDSMSEHGFAKIAEEQVLDHTYRLYENGKARSRLFIADQVAVVSDAGAALAALAADPDSSTVYLSHFPPDLAIPSGRGGGAVAELTEYSATAVTGRVETDEPVVVVLADSALPQWQVRVDDDVASSLVANGVFRAVVVPAGEHTVRWEYHSPATQRAVQITSGTVLVAIMLLLPPTWRRVRHWLK